MTWSYPENRNNSIQMPEGVFSSLSKTYTVSCRNFIKRCYIDVHNQRNSP